MVAVSKLRKIREKAVNQARSSTPKPNLLTWCIRSALYHLYGHRPYY